MQTLLKRSLLYPGESLRSLFVRLSAANYYSQTNTLQTICQNEMMQPQDKIYLPRKSDTYQILSNLTEIPSTELYLATPHRFTTTLTPPGQPIQQISLNDEDAPLLTPNYQNKYIWPDSDTQFCPLCLKDEAFHQLSWVLFPITTCLKHNCFLQHKCYRCAQKISVKDIVQCCCSHCNFDLRETPINSIENDPIGLFSQAAIQSWFGLLPVPSSPDHSHIWNHPSNVLFCFIHGLSRGMSIITNSDYLHHPLPDVNLPINQEKTNLSPKQVFVLYATALRGLENWPQGFFSCLGKLQAQAGKGQLQREFGVVYRYWLERGWRHPAFEFIQEAFDQYLCDNFLPSPSLWRLRRIQQNPRLKDKLAFMTEAEACQHLGCIPKTIEKFVTDGVLLRFEQIYPHADVTTFKLLRRHEVGVLQKRLQKNLTLTQTADRFGVSTTVIVNLHQAGFLAAFSGFYIDNSATWTFDLDSILHFEQKLRSVCHPRLNGTLCSLLKASQIIAAHDGRMSTLIYLILEGEVRACWKEDQELGDMSVNQEDLYRWLVKVRKQKSLISRKQIAEMLNVKIHTVSVWVENGLLIPRKMHGSNPYFQRYEVEQFIENHLFSEEAAQILQVGILTVQKWARNGRLHPVSGPYVDGLHRHLFKREEVLCFKPENVVTAPQLARELGLSRTQLHQWIKQGKILPITGPGIDQMKHFLFLRSEL